MNRSSCSFVLYALVLISALAVFSQNAEPQSASAAQIGRGRYLVESVAACGDCHTPMNERGEPVKEKWMQGTMLFFKPTVPIPNWADKSPNIAGLPGWTDEQAIKFFMTGIAYNGLRANPPMPQYRLTRSDAAAVVAYLRSLKTGAGSR